MMTCWCKTMLKGIFRCLIHMLEIFVERQKYKRSLKIAKDYNYWFSQILSFAIFGIAYRSKIIGVMTCAQLSCNNHALILLTKRFKVVSL